MFAISVELPLIACDFSKHRLRVEIISFYGKVLFFFFGLDGKKLTEINRSTVAILQGIQILKNLRFTYSAK